MTQIFIICGIWVVSTLLIFVVLHRYLIRYTMEEYSKILDDLEAENTALIDFLTELQKRSIESYERITQVDKRGSFASDDEVGFVFQFLKSNVADIYTFLTERVKKSEK